MFDGLLKPKFYNKCKAEIRLMKTRMETIKKKRHAVQKYLKSDIAELLKAGHDINAYGRAEGLLVEQNMSSCYDFIEQFCGCISNNLSAMAKQRECPEECKEATPSLMYAAARFADLPELRELRKLFNKKYGSSLEHYINKEFVEKLKQQPPTKDMKLQLMHNIAQEFSIEWDSKALEQKLFTPPPPKQDRPDHAFFKKNEDDDAYEKSDNGFKLHKGEKKEDVPILRTERTDVPILRTESTDPDTNRPSNYKFIPPPYTRSSKPESSSEEPTKSDSNEVAEIHHEDGDKPKPRSVRRRPLKPPPGRDEISNRPTKKVDDIDQMDEEEKMIDGLLMHYSKKKGAEKLVSSPPKATSLSAETLAGHVHPKLPDCDELAARLAALNRER